MNNKLFFASLMFVGDLICSASEDYMQLPRAQAISGTRTDEQARQARQARLEIAQIRAAEIAAQASEAAAQASRIIMQKETAKASKETVVKRISREDQDRATWIIRWLIAGPQECKAISQIAPYSKMVTLEAKVKDLVIREDMVAQLRTNTESLPAEECLYSILCSAPLDELYTHNSEAFSRASAFEGLSFLKPSDISHLVLESGHLNSQQKTKFLNIVHGLRPGTIERKGQSLVMSYQGEGSLWWS